MVFSLVPNLSHPAGTLLCPWSVLICNLKLLRLAGVTSLCAFFMAKPLVFGASIVKMSRHIQAPFESLNTCLQISAGAVSTLGWPHLYCMSG